MAETLWGSIIGNCGYSTGSIGAISASTRTAGSSTFTYYKDRMRFPNNDSTLLPWGSVLGIPIEWNAINDLYGVAAIVPSGYQYNCVAVTIVGSSLYALFTVQNDSQENNSAYQQSTVIRMHIHATTGALTYTAGDYVQVGKNAATLESHDNKLYVCCIGGKLRAGSENADSLINIVDLSTFPAAGSVSASVTSATSGATGDFRDITILDSRNVYVLTGHYDSTYLKLVGRVYHTTAANLESGNIGNVVIAVNDPGIRGFHAIPCSGADRFWFINE